MIEMEKTKCKLNICGVEVTAAGVDSEAAERIAGAVRTRMQAVLGAAYGVSIEKAAVLTAMNLCEELARRDAELEEIRAHEAQLEDELAQIGGADGLRIRLQQAEGKLKLCEEQLRRLQEAEKNAEKQAREKPAAREPKAPSVPLKNPLRPDFGDEAGLVSFFEKE